eukprot:11180857-Lingulodinium_polyedra.AAC.1
MNKSEKVRGNPTQNDPQAKHTGEETLGDRYETAVQRGVYSATSWEKARSYACPYANKDISKVAAHIVL